MKSAVIVLTIVSQLAMSAVLIYVLPFFIGRSVGHALADKASRASKETREKYDPAFREEVTASTAGLDLAPFREMAEELDLDLRVPLERLQEPDGGLWEEYVGATFTKALGARESRTVGKAVLIAHVMVLCLVGLGYLADRKVKAPRSVRERLEGVHRGVWWKVVTRHFPALMIVLSVAVVGLSIYMWSSSAWMGITQNLGELKLDCLYIALEARDWYRKAAERGGGGGSWEGLTFEALSLGPSTEHGTYLLTPTDSLLAVTGTGVVKDRAGHPVRSSTVYDAGSDRLSSWNETITW